jgi:hypothetical protein
MKPFRWDYDYERRIQYLEDRIHALEAKVNAKVINEDKKEEKAEIVKQAEERGLVLGE